MEIKTVERKSEIARILGTKVGSDGFIVGSSPLFTGLVVTVTSKPVAYRLFKIREASTCRPSRVYNAIRLWVTSTRRATHTVIVSIPVILHKFATLVRPLIA